MRRAVTQDVKGFRISGGDQLDRGILFDPGI
jgi:hypothetical protein